MLNSFCQILVTLLGLTLPWQLLAAHPPGPLYLPTPLLGGTGVCCAAVRLPGTVKNAAAARMAHEIRMTCPKYIVVCPSIQLLLCRAKKYLGTGEGLYSTPILQKVGEKIS